MQSLTKPWRTCTITSTCDLWRNGKADGKAWKHWSRKQRPMMRSWLNLSGLEQRCTPYASTARKIRKKVKGVKSNVVAKSITFNDYTRRVFDEIEMMREQSCIRSKLHEMYTISESIMSIIFALFSRVFNTVCQFVICACIVAKVHWLIIFNTYNFSNYV